MRTRYAIVALVAWTYGREIERLGAEWLALNAAMYADIPKYADYPPVVAR